MKRLRIFDTTLRDGEQAPGFSMSVNQKVEIAKKLDEMGVDSIEAGFAASNERDFEAIRDISKVVKSSEVVSMARCTRNDIDIAYEAIKGAKFPKIHLFIATSSIHMKYKLHKSELEVLNIVKDSVGYAKKKGVEVEFTLEDATRTDKNFACKVIDTAIESGASVINIPDTVGIMTPFEFCELINYLKAHSRLNEVLISVHCHNDLGMATANSLASLRCGVDQVECTVNGIGERAGNAALEEILAALSLKGESLKYYSSINLSKIKCVSDMVVSFTGATVQKNKAIVGENAFKHEAGIHQAGILSNPLTYEIMNPKDFGIEDGGLVLGIHSGKNAIIDKIKKLDLNIKDYDIDLVVKNLKEYFDINDFLGEREFIHILNKNKFFSKKRQEI